MVGAGSLPGGAVDLGAGRTAATSRSVVVVVAASIWAVMRRCRDGGPP